ncbi:aldehyde dehydrogenase family protein [Nesterenkonia sp. YGD6]|uniref:aldehyde dehydrogenase family protein n=1 Tax=Nesterenkonia sp. YGD6 TaxID=2901231 RepID=UPI00314504B5
MAAYFRMQEQAERLRDLIVAGNGKSKTDAAAAQAALPEGTNAALLAPTLLTGVPVDAEIRSGEIFGPVAPVVAWTGLDAVIGRANAVEVRLSGYVYAGKLQTATKIAERLEAGMVGLTRAAPSPSPCPGPSRRSACPGSGSRASAAPRSPPP